MNRFVFVLGGAIASLAIAFCITDELTSRIPGVTERNFRRIKKGMPLREVEWVLGARAEQRILYHDVRGLSSEELHIWQRPRLGNSTMCVVVKIDRLAEGWPVVYSRWLKASND